MPEWLLVPPQEQSLLKDRETLADSMLFDVDDRRLEKRLAVPRRRASVSSSIGALLDVRRSGLAVKMPGKCRFARGESHILVLKVDAGTVEVPTEVRWTDSEWKGEESTRHREFVQRAGFEIDETVSPDTRAILTILGQMVRDRGVRVDVFASQATTGARRRDGSGC